MGAVSPSKRTGLFKFFSKETEQEKRAREAREKEAAELRAEQRAEEELQKTRNQIVAADEKCEAPKKRKREEQERKYLAEVDAGVRNDDFTLKTYKKRKVCSHLNLILDPASFLSDCAGRTQRQTKCQQNG
jgi:hypothetical protein